VTGILTRKHYKLVTPLSAVITATAALAVAVGASNGAPARHKPPVAAAYSGVTPPPVPAGIHKIKHVIVIMQENRSFDSYFGTYPGADGFPTNHGHFTTCVPDPATHGCDYPFHEPVRVNMGAEHNPAGAIADIDGGKMDGFVAVAESTGGHVHNDVMGYHDAREIPNYWTYAHDYVLQDHLFESDASWSLPSHLFVVSEWAASCAGVRPMSCVNDDVQEAA
jgi:phospholipase C